MKRILLSLICLALVGVSLRGCIRRREEVLTKTWQTKADFEAGTLNNVLVPEGTNRLELKRKALSGTATYIVFGAEGWNHPHNRVMNWQTFEHTKDNTKTILRDDFRENSFGEYYLEKPSPDWSYGAPSYDSANKRIYFHTDAGFSLRPKNLSVKNFVLSYGFYADLVYYSHCPFMTMGRWVDANNMYQLLTSYLGTQDLGSPRIHKWVAGSETLLARKLPGVFCSLGNQYNSRVTLNGNSLKIEVPGLATVSTTDSSLPNSGGVKFGAGQGRGWIDNLLLEHYSLPSPPGTSVSFKFWPSKDGVNFGSEYTDIKLVPNACYIKVQATLSRNSLASAMPVLNSMTLTYKLLVEPIFI